MSARRLQDKCPDRSFLILEEREAMGGTCDLYRYPDIRSDSDMYTLGYNFKPWTEGKASADGPSILRCIRETAAETGVEEKIRYQHSVTAAIWSSEDANSTNFKKILKRLHKAALIHYDTSSGSCTLVPPGHVEAEALAVERSATVLWPYCGFEREKPMRDIGRDNKSLNGGQGQN